ncbi:MAG TPA: cytochrome ubiquinol oxidase subunit I [Egicoccus sp.]|nr:cytochrome ubiquinol oxidase subunit I [Egicoccus sp.]HSK23627.1 cytochrome ubiquinol oxidase subunit I [Egicoccus sp.]
MDALDLARLQFGSTTIYHFFFVPMTIGLAPLVAIFHTQYVRTGAERYRRLAKFWGKVFLIIFAMGLVTGIVQEFQFGMNWSDYSRFVGDIFGAPLALEALLAFFLESTFLGLWIFGWDRLPPRLHLASIWLVVLGTHVSAFFILAANSWMHWPVGYEIDPVTGQARLTDFVAVLTNPHLMTQFPHTILAAWATGAFLVLGVSAYYLLRKRDTDVFASSARVAVTIALISSLGVAFVGHAQSQLMTRQQPMKMAAAEALWDTESSAGWSLFAVGDIEQGRNRFNIQIPGALSLLATNSLDGTVEGINDLQAEYEQTYGPGDYRPNIGVTYWSFRLMVGAGMLMIGLAALGLLFSLKGRIADPDARWTRWWLRALPLAIGLPILANTTGWLMTEMGRQPWVVFGVMHTADGVSPAVSSSYVLTSLLSFTVVYGVLLVVTLGLLRRQIRTGPPPLVDEDLDDDHRTFAPLGAY